MRKAILFFMLILLISACSPSKDNSEKKINEISTIDSIASINAQKEEIMTILVEMWDAIEMEDIERYAGYIHDDFTQFGETDTLMLDATLGIVVLDTDELFVSAVPLPAAFWLFASGASLMFGVSRRRTAIN